MKSLALSVDPVKIVQSLFGIARGGCFVWETVWVVLGTVKGNEVGSRFIAQDIPIEMFGVFSNGSFEGIGLGTFCVLHSACSFYTGRCGQCCLDFFAARRSWRKLGIRLALVGSARAAEAVTLFLCQVTGSVALAF